MFYRALQPVVYLALATASVIVPWASAQWYFEWAITAQGTLDLLLAALVVPILLTLHAGIVARLLQQTIRHAPEIKAWWGKEPVPAFAPTFVVGYAIAGALLTGLFVQHPRASLAQDVALARAILRQAEAVGGAPPVQDALARWTQSIPIAHQHRYDIWELARAQGTPEALELFWDVHGQYALPAESVRFVRANRLVRQRDVRALELALHKLQVQRHPNALVWQGQFNAIFKQLSTPGRPR